QMNEFALDFQVVRILEQVRIGQIAGERGVVVAQSRAQQHGPRALHRHDEIRKMARVPVIEALGAPQGGNCVAVVVEHAKGVAVLQNKSPHVQKRRGRLYRKRLVQFGRRLLLSRARACRLTRPFALPLIVHHRPKRQQFPRLLSTQISTCLMSGQYCRPFKAVVGRNLTQKRAGQVEHSPCRELAFCPRPLHRADRLPTRTGFASMGFKCGIVGLPNVGKSTLFNALTQTAAAQAANYPFCTIEPNVGEVSVPDERLEKIAAAAKSQKIIPTRLTFVDIAGLVRGASKGEGLGNQFLANIRECDAIAYVLRCFVDDDVTHVEGRVDPIADAETVETELMLADLESLERRRAAAEKKAKGQDKEAKALLALIDIALKYVSEGKPARLAFAEIPESEHRAFQQLQLLTSKPALYVCNVDEAHAATGNAYSKSVHERFGGEGVEVVVISAKIEAELAQLDEEERT